MNAVIETIESADSWLAATKKISTNGNIKKGTKLKRARELYVEALNFKLNFTNEMKPLRAAIIQAENWIADNVYLLERLAIPFEPHGIPPLCLRTF